MHVKLQLVITWARTSPKLTLCKGWMYAQGIVQIPSVQSADFVGNVSWSETVQNRMTLFWRHARLGGRLKLELLRRKKSDAFCLIHCVSLAFKNGEHQKLMTQFLPSSNHSEFKSVWTPLALPFSAFDTNKAAPRRGEKGRTRWAVRGRLVKTVLHAACLHLCRTQ